MPVSHPFWPLFNPFHLSCFAFCQCGTRCRYLLCPSAPSPKHFTITICTTPHSLGRAFQIPHVVVVGTSIRRDCYQFPLDHKSHPRHDLSSPNRIQTQLSGMLQLKFRRRFTAAGQIDDSGRKLRNTEMLEEEIIISLRKIPNTIQEYNKFSVLI